MYLLDTNVFIEAKNRYYAFDLAPGFWEGLDADAAAGRSAASRKSVLSFSLVSMSSRAGPEPTRPCSPQRTRQRC